jgi:hypothetical protein
MLLQLAMALLASASVLFVAGVLILIVALVRALFF